MVYATRGNKVLRIEEYNIRKYVEQGYNIIGDAGEVLQSAVPTDINVLKKAYAQHVKEISELKAEVEALKAELAKKAVSKPKSEPKAEKVEAVVEEAKPVVESDESIAKAEEALNRPRKSRAKSKE